MVQIAETCAMTGGDDGGVGEFGPKRTKQRCLRQLVER